MREGLRLVWDRLGLILALSLTWTLLFSLPLTLAQRLPASLPPLARNGALLLAAALILSAPTAGMFLVAHRVCERDEVAYTDLWRGAARLFAPATRLGLLHAAVIILFPINLWFYLSVRSPLGVLASLACLYALLLWLMMTVTHFPLLVAQETGVFDEPDRPAKRGVRAVLRRSLYLALGEPFWQLGLLAALAVITALLFVTVALPPLLWPGTLAVLTTQAARALLVKYGILPAPPIEEAVPDEQFRIRT